MAPYTRSMAMRSRRVSRCGSCGLPEAACLCGGVAKVASKTKVAVVAHHTEWRRSSNTGRLLALVLQDVRIVLRGAQTNASADVGPHCVGRRLVLFPWEDSRELRATDAGDVTLVVPEGSWSQARRAMRREPWCEGAEVVRLPGAPSSRYRLRSAPHAGELSTFEAVAHAIAILEGESVAARMWPLFERFVERSLAVRGRRSDVWPQEARSLRR